MLLVILVFNIWLYYDDGDGDGLKKQPFIWLGAIVEAILKCRGSGLINVSPFYINN